MNLIRSSEAIHLTTDCCAKGELILIKARGYSLETANFTEDFCTIMGSKTRLITVKSRRYS